MARVQIQVASDDFARGDGPLGTGNWANSVGTINIVTQAIQPAAGLFNVGNWIGAGSFGNNQYAEAKIVGTNANRAIGLAVNVSGTIFYYAMFDITDGHLYVGKNSGANEEDGGAISVTTNDVLNFQNDGNTLTVKKNGDIVYQNNPVWATLTGGTPGVCIYNDGANRLDNWKGGNVTDLLADPGYPISDITVNGWTTAPLYEKLSDNSDATYIVSSGTPSDDMCEVALSGLVDPGVSTGHTIHYRAAITMSGGHSLAVALYQGGTLIATITNSGLLLPFADYSYVLSATEADNITNYSDLRLRFTANQL